MTTASVVVHQSFALALQIQLVIPSLARMDLIRVELSILMCLLRVNQIILVLRWRRSVLHRESTRSVDAHYLVPLVLTPIQTPSRPLAASSRLSALVSGLCQTHQEASHVITSAVQRTNAVRYNVLVHVTISVQIIQILHTTVLIPLQKNLI